MTSERDGGTIANPAQVVFEYKPYRRLAYTWLTFTPELARLLGLDDELFARVSSERRSRVAFDIEPVSQMVKLTIVHDDFEPGSTVKEMVGNGWSQFLSSLKTLLETGQILEIHPRAAQ